MKYYTLHFYFSIFKSLFSYHLKIMAAAAATTHLNNSFFLFYLK